MGNGDSSCCGVTETKVVCHKVMAGCDRYPMSFLLPPLWYLLDQLLEFPVLVYLLYQEAQTGLYLAGSNGK